MCGIVGYCGKQQALPFLLEGLEKLEYRGYDSAGVAILGDNIQTVKAQGRLKNLVQRVGKIDGAVGIGHTRWATHGAPSDQNAHPHLSRNKKFALVHNGIIENYSALKEFLLERSFPFESETDTEVIAHLIEYYYRGDAIEALIKTAQRLKGSYALAVLCADSPDELYAMRKDSPLVIGAANGAEAGFLASDMSALLSYTRDFIVPEDGEIAVISRDGGVKVQNFNREPVLKTVLHADWDRTAAQKTGFEHFMLKEIYEQPKAAADTLSSLKARLERLKTLQNVKKIIMLGCGSAYHAGVAGKYFIEKYARIPVDCDIASEFRYKNPIIDDGTLAIAISQSGETADTLAAMAEAKKSAPVLSLVNVLGSSAARASDEVIYTLAGPEIAVATTKGYLSQATALWAIGLFLAGRKNHPPDGLPAGLSGNASKNQRNLLKNISGNVSENSSLPGDLAGSIPLYSQLESLPSDIAELLKNKQMFQQLSARFSSSASAFFIGRGIDYAIAMEGALKLKEISYMHAQSYPAGELKHGTISLIEKGSLVVAVSTDPALAAKTVSNIREVQSRGAVVLSVSCFDEVLSASDYAAKIKGGLNSPLLAAVSLQLFAYYVALARGCDIDKPRNLAKSVTVE